MRAAVLLFPLAIGVGCKKDPVSSTDDDTGDDGSMIVDDVSGIWQLQVPWMDTSGCEDTITSNYANAYVPREGGSEWTSDSTTDYSDALKFVWIETDGLGGAVMVVGSDAYPGTQSDEGKWIFSWTGTSTAEATNDHPLGYLFNSTQTSSTTTTVIFGAEAGVASGSWSSSAVSALAWTESDTWSAEVGVSDYGQTPVYNYLVRDELIDGQIYEGVTVYNMREESDCSGVCQLSVSTSCSGSVQFSGVRTGFDVDYDQLEDAGQSFGG